MEHGFRPCHRCRPDLNIEYHNSYIAGFEIVERALRLICDGFLNYHSIDELASKVCISPRQLRKLFVDNIGIPPVKISRYHKAIFARKLLLNSKAPVTEIAFAAGFGSTRQFNASYIKIFNESPRATRLSGKSTSAAGTCLMLKYKKPFDFEQLLAFMRPRLIAGVETVQNNHYSRTFRTEYTSGWVTVVDRPAESALELTVHSDDIRCSDNPCELQYFFPGPEDLAGTDISDIGITQTRQQAIQTVTAAAIDGRLDLGSAQSLNEFSTAFRARKGIGPWTVNYTAMRPSAYGTFRQTARSKYVLHKT